MASTTSVGAPELENKGSLLRHFTSVEQTTYMRNERQQKIQGSSQTERYLVFLLSIIIVSIQSTLQHKSYRLPTLPIPKGTVT